MSISFFFIFKQFFNENFRNFLNRKILFFWSQIFWFSYKFQWKFSKIFDLKNFQKVALTFFIFKNFWWFFFMDRGSFSVRRRWDRLEVSVLQLEARAEKPTLFVRFVTNTYLWKSAYSELTLYYGTREFSLNCLCEINL